jgi:hypothetical protein
VNLEVRLRRSEKEEAKNSTSIQFDLTKAMSSMTILHPGGASKTPSVSPVKARRLNSMNGDYASCSGFVRDHHCSMSSASSLPPNLLEILSPSSGSTSSSSSSSSSSLSASHVFDDTNFDDSISPSRRSSCPRSRDDGTPSSSYLSTIIQTTIHEEAVEMTLSQVTLEVEDTEMVFASAYNHCRVMGDHDDDDADGIDGRKHDDDDDDDINNDNNNIKHNDDDNDPYANTTCLDSSIVVGASTDCDDYHTTPPKVEYCGIVWPCCHSATPFLVDDNLHSKICASLAMEHWTCWQITYQASPTARPHHHQPLGGGVQRSYRRGHKNLDSLRRMLLPLEPKKTQSFSPQYPTTRRNHSFGSCDNSGYESDPEVHAAAANNKKATPLSATSPTTNNSTLRATTIDEFFNERLRLVEHTAHRSRVVTFWLERGMARFAIPPQICWHDGTHRTAIPILEITKVLSGVVGAATDDRSSLLSIPASSQRCFRISISDGTMYTLEASSVSMQRDLTTLLKTTVATLAAAVLTQGNVDEFFVRKEAWI